MAKTTLPSLDSNNGSVGLDNLQRQSALQSKADAVVDLQKNPFKSAFKTLSIFKNIIIHQSAIDEPVHREVQGTRMDSIHGASGFGERSVGSS